MPAIRMFLRPQFEVRNVEHGARKLRRYRPGEFNRRLPGGGGPPRKPPPEWSKTEALDALEDYASGVSVLDLTEFGLGLIPLVGAGLAVGDLLDDYFSPDPDGSPSDPGNRPSYRPSYRPGFPEGDWGFDPTNPYYPDPQFPFNPAEPYGHPDPEAWCLKAHCNTGPPTVGYTGHHRRKFTTPGLHTCSPTRLSCISGQSDNGTMYLPGQPIDLPANSVRWGLWYRYETAGGGVFRNKHWRSYVRLKAETGWLMPSPPSFGPVGPNPNRVRAAPGVRPQPQSPRHPPPRAPQPLPDFQWDSRGGKPPRRHSRTPPRPGEREAKLLSRSAKIGLAVYRALDWLSEKAEIVDAIYEALPADVRKRWSKGRSDKRGMVDQFGQYGIEGADWKAQAIWHNLHKVDLEQAVKNIIRNEVEDKLIGFVHRNLPRNTINAFDRTLPGGRQMTMEQFVSAKVEELFSQLGLE